jgi:hypothetical protein
MKTYLFEVNLLSGPRAPRRVSREIEVPEFFSLYQLAGTINDAYGFAFDHPFGFFSDIDTSKYFNSRRRYDLFTDMIERGMDVEPSGAESVEKTNIGQVWESVGDNMLFLFDYGDCWFFVVELKAFGQVAEDRKYPRIFNRIGRSPRQY